MKKTAIVLLPYSAIICDIFGNVAVDHRLALSKTSLLMLTEQKADVPAAPLAIVLQCCIDLIPVFQLFFGHSMLQSQLQLEQ